MSFKQDIEVLKKFTIVRDSLRFYGRQEVQIGTLAGDLASRQAAWYDGMGQL